MKRAIRRILVSVALALLASALPLASVAADAPPKQWHYEVWNGLMSPFCPGRSLLDCPSPQAAELRTWIADQEAAGRRREDVEAQLYAQFGDVILQAPKASGFGLAAYVIPAIGVLLGALVLILFLRRQTAAAPQIPRPVLAPPDPELERRIDEEMRR